MLPGFRLIAVSFLGGFLVMFVGLRMVASLNNIHEGLPLLAAQAATAPRIGMIEPRGNPMPVLYDLRFVGSPNAPMLINVAPEALERVLPAVTPVSLATDDLAKTTAVAPAETTDKPQAPAAIEATKEVAKPVLEIIAAIETPPATPPAAAAPTLPVVAEPLRAIERPLSIDLPAETTASVPQAVAEPTLTPISEPSAPVEAVTDATIRTAALPAEPEPAAVLAATPTPKQAKASRRAAAKAARKKQSRAARRTVTRSQPPGQAGGFGANSFSGH